MRRKSELDFVVFSFLFKQLHFKAGVLSRWTFMGAGAFAWHSAAKNFSVGVFLVEAGGGWLAD